VNPTAEPRPLVTGTVLGGGYRIVRPLAEGGMGTVYEVEQSATGARRALKVMHGHFAGDLALRARFVREARMAASIESDHVAQVVDAGHDEATGALYIVMELLEGTTLSHEIRRRGAFAWPDVLEILRQIAHALGAAHACGIVHRDLKPANVFLSRSRHVGLPLMVKVLDFGIAKAIAASNDATTVLGTPTWMAPEQKTLDTPVGPQADVWAFGLLAFLLLTGKHYFPSPDAKAGPAPGRTDEPQQDAMPPASARADLLGTAHRLPAGFDDWFARCVARDPTARFDDANAAYIALAHLPAPAAVEPLPPTLSKNPPPMGAPTLRRIDTPVTVIETPHPSLASRAGARTDAPATSSPPSSMGRLGSVRLAAVGTLALAAVGSALWMGLGRRSGESPQAASLPAAVRAPASPLVRLHGSNTIGAELAPAIAEAFLQRRTGAKTIVRRRTAPDEEVVEARDGERTLDAIEIDAHGSATAFEDLGAGRCDIGMSSRRIKDEETAKLSSLGNLASAASEHVIALDGIAVIVNPTNPVSTLNKAQVRDVFAGVAVRWSEVGGAGQPIAVYARDDKSGTYDSFVHMALGGRALTQGAKRYESSEELSDAVAADANAVGFIGLPYVRSAKAVMVRETDRSPALLPSPLTVSTEDYALARRLYFYLPPGAPIAARDFLDFALSEDGQRAVQSAGFVDLRPTCDPNAARCTSCSGEYREAVRGACRLSVDFRFDHGSAQLDTRALRDLQRIVTLMSHPENAGRSIVLLGFTDVAGAGRGPNPADDGVPLRERLSVVASQLRARGLHLEGAHALGPDMPVADETTEEGRERDRRIEVWLK